MVSNTQGNQTNVALDEWGSRGCQLYIIGISPYMLGLQFYNLWRITQIMDLVNQIEY